MAKLSVDKAMLKAKSHAKKGEIEEAQKLYQAVLQAFPKNKRAQNGLAALNKPKHRATTQGLPQDTMDQLINLYNQRQLAAAVGHAKALTEQYPEAFIIWNILGAANKGLGQVQAASEAFKKATELNPSYAEGFNNLGITLQDQGKLDEAIESYSKALALKSDYAEAYYNMGYTLQDQGKLDEAIEFYRKALSLKSDYPEAYYNMGITLQDQGKLDKAIESYSKALALKSDYAEAYNNMGITLQVQGKLDEAVESYSKALALKSDYADAYYNMSIPHLLQGSLEEGFNFYEWRLRKKERPVAPARANFIWDGKQSLNNKRFVVYEEQGLGDIIQFCRYLPLLEQKGADLTFKVKPALHALLQTMDSGVMLSTTAPDETQIDFEAPLMSLPHLFKTQLDTIPATSTYLYADQDRTAIWGERLNIGSFKIGICWQGSEGKVDIGRSFPLSLFEGISKTPNVELISLHKGEGESQIESVSFDLTTLGADFDVGVDAFLDTAAVMMNCDLIITSDTAVAHLAGALGCKTWVALKHVPDWRWMLNRFDSPWYPTMTLYRQKSRGDWAFVFDAIEQDLGLLIDQKV